MRLRPRCDVPLTQGRSLGVPPQAPARNLCSVRVTTRENGEKNSRRLFHRTRIIMIMRTRQTERERGLLFIYAHYVMMNKFFTWALVENNWNLAGSTHGAHNSGQMLIDENDERRARLFLVRAAVCSPLSRNRRAHHARDPSKVTTHSDVQVEKCRPPIRA